MSDEFAALQRDLAESLAEQGIEIARHGDCVVLKGHVETDDRREAILNLAAVHFAMCEVQNDITVGRVMPPAEAEEVA